MSDSSSGAAKRVVYLIGAGASHGEAAYIGASSINLLMQSSDEFGEGITSRILDKSTDFIRTFVDTNQGVDIEKLISLLTATGIPEHVDAAETIRKLYFEEIRDGLHEARIISYPELAVALLSMHQVEGFRKNVEQLTGVLTTNHDGLFQLASQLVYGGVNVGFPFFSTVLNQIPDVDAPTIVQLHGSFTWGMGVPIEINPLEKETRYSKSTVWIPPTVLKETKTYPFNKLAGLAYEMLAKNCDVLRVIGASLTQNDWNILSLIFNAQRHREFVRGSPFVIELIMPHQAGLRIQRECGYLKNLVPIGFLTDGSFSDYKEEETTNSDMRNPFAYWLQQKALYHASKGQFAHSGFRKETIAEVA